MYRIEVTEVTERETGPSLEYQKVADTGNRRDGGAVFEYVEIPNAKNVRTSERRVLVQEVETVDLPAVIKAINNL